MINKYFQEFKLNDNLIQQIKQLNLVNTISRNMSEEGVYSLTPHCMDLLNRMESHFIKASALQLEEAENALEEIASRDLKINELDGLEFSFENDECRGIVIHKGLRVIIAKTVISQNIIEDDVIMEAPELFWMIHKDSPIMNPEARKLVIQIQYFNQLIKIAK